MSPCTTGSHLTSRLLALMLAGLVVDTCIMTPFFRAAATIAAVLLAAASERAQAQPSLTVDVGLNSAYVWRGVTSTNRFVVQPDLVFSAPVRGLTLSLGAWGNIEPARYDGPGDLSSLGGLPGPLVTQSQLWAEIAGQIAGRVDASFGAEGYLYPRVGRLDDYNTVELYATASFDGFVTPSVSVSYDVGAIRGGYVEAGLARAITGERRGSVTLGLAAGFSAGQAPDARGRDLSYFDHEGPTHLDASTSASFSIGAVTLAPEAHLVIAHDALATMTGPDKFRRAKLWLGTTISWSTARE